VSNSVNLSFESVGFYRSHRLSTAVYVSVASIISWVYWTCTLPVNSKFCNTDWKPFSRESNKPVL